MLPQIQFSHLASTPCPCHVYLISILYCTVLGFLAAGVRQWRFDLELDYYTAPAWKQVHSYSQSYGHG